MALQTRLAKTPAKAAVDAVGNALSTGSGANPIIYIYGGTQNTSPDEAEGGAALATVDLGTADVMAAATTGTGDYVSASSAILPKSDTSASVGTATWFRAVNKGGTPIIDGAVGTSTTTADMALDSTTISAGQTVKINSWKIRLQYKG